MKLYNHIAFKMGKHEAEIAPHIPEGGNWKDIPLTISDARLTNIRASGGRTTYYGRLSWDEPSYTIATYFNRVGNGCNLHPSQCRVMSNREAARLQSFPDDFVFKGSVASQYKQIGNAVPPLLARAVACLIKPHLNSYSFVDLFAGCGGLSEGFIMDGYSLVAANELDRSIMSTYAYNHSRYTSEDNFIVGDITLDETKQKLLMACGRRNIDVVIGGPPCQGFSYAGWRDPNDKRNQLFKEFVEMVERLKPSFFVMENVPGILTMRKGEAMKEIIQAFADVGYFVNQPIKLNAEEFGVPQRRKRVFIIGSKDGVIVNAPSPLFRLPDNCKTRRKTVQANAKLPIAMSVRDAIESLPALDNGGGYPEMDYNPSVVHPYDRLMRREITFEEFYNMCIAQ
ncbi:DNA (cytosine-5-)-methyltransferase [Bacteroides gallinaceum]|uniref:Cytosine-specific methyltransferase n=1 Tax=Bacteroides gallinaceum TaxID=1462571 RepID=A0ABT7VGL2_9BACE|nr:DNA (cytosine-5-)-methyltransferase [Bacteroides gallinaceum]MDM8207424.1 DNA (cytosine-5-)-methyltransferase [Bacteroides gallinaceum]MDM8325445.1 DNA (cytosine-5-)-methyltransferase [Bacteroides gallinaceum]